MLEITKDDVYTKCLKFYAMKAMISISNNLAGWKLLKWFYVF